jgi:hypothetical protein
MHKDIILFAGKIHPGKKLLRSLQNNCDKTHSLNFRNFVISKNKYDSF